VLDANNAIVLNNGGTYHDFSGYGVDLYAQVSGATVVSYSWTFGGTLSDFTSASGQSSYHLNFTWASFTGAEEHSDTVTITVNSTGGAILVQTFTFKVIGTDSPANSSPRPTTSSTWPGVLTPDLMTDRQKMVRSQYYRLGLATGEVETS